MERISGTEHVTNEDVLQCVSN